MAESFRNRIVGYGERPASEFLANPFNPRVHPARQRLAVKASLESLGWVAPVIVNSRSGYLIDGHERIWQALQKSDDAPVPYLEVDLSPTEEAQFLATFDYITYLAEYRSETLEQLIQQMSSAPTELIQLANEALRDVSDQVLSDKYPATFNLIAPIYRPAESQPAVRELADLDAIAPLLADIESAHLPHDLKSFLRAAACRLVKIDFDKAADYYAHAPAAVQRLFERAALVIVDYDRAVELGFAEFIEDARIHLPEADDGNAS